VYLPACGEVAAKQAGGVEPTTVVKVQPPPGEQSLADLPRKRGRTKPGHSRANWGTLSPAPRLKAAKKKDYAAAKKAYGTMITACNACHTRFDGGKNQLTP